MSLLDKIKKAGAELSDALTGTPTLLREIKGNSSDVSIYNLLTPNWLAFLVR